MEDKIKGKEEKIEKLEKSLTGANNHSAQLMKELEIVKRNLQKAQNQHNLQVFNRLLISIAN